MEQLDNVTKWEVTGLLQGIDDAKHRKDLADTLEKMARFALISNVNLRREEFDAASMVIFPIIRKIMSMNNYKPLDNFRVLYQEVVFEFEEYKKKNKNMDFDAEIEFIAQFSEKNKDKFIFPAKEEQG